MRRLIAFDCAGETLLGTLDEGTSTTGLLIVSGGNEIRAGAHRGMALLAARLAATGTPVFRFDRRGVGDSEGENLGFEQARDDLIAAAATFRAEQPHVTRLIGFGNCDAASTLALFGHDAEIEAVLLTNPWVVAPVDDLPPQAAIRARYAARLADPQAWRQLIAGNIDFGKLARGLARIARRSPQASLATRVLAAIDDWSEAVTILLAEYDGTAIAYRAAAKGRTTRTITLPTSSHSFASEADKAALEAAIRAML